ncbi:MAG: O-antigen polymerase [Candidatus Doudnabacteria bacterium]|nr:O-antigen polymerase [Candidatus Doudnabacteria bacterium]
MKLNQTFIEKILFGIFLITLPLNRRHIFSWNLSESEFTRLSLYISDLALIAWLGFGYIFRDYPHKGRILATVGIVIFFSVEFISPRGTYNWFSLLKLEELALLLFYLAFVARGIKQTTDYFVVFKPLMAILGILQSSLAILQFVMQRSVGLKLVGEDFLNNSIIGVAKIDIGPLKLIRGYGTFPHPNVLSAFLLVVCATCAYAFITTKSYQSQVFYGFCLFGSTLGNFATFSRSGLVVSYVTLISIIYLIYREVPGKIEQIKKIGMVLLFATIIGVTSFLPFLKARAINTASTEFSRTYYNQIAIRIIKEHPFGVGFGNMINEMRKTIKPTSEIQVQPPHNYFLTVACEAGIEGVAFIIIIFGYLIYLLSRGFKKIVPDETKIFSTIFLITFLGIIMLMFFDHYFYTIQQTQLLLWLIVGLILNQRIVVKNFLW